MGLFLGLYVFSVDLCVCFLMPVLNCFDYYNFEISFEIRKRDASSFVLLSQDRFVCLGSRGSIQIVYLLYFCGKCHWNFDRDDLESVYCFG